MIASSAAIVSTLRISALLVLEGRVAWCLAPDYPVVGSRRSDFGGYVDNRFRKCFRRFLRQVVADSTLDRSVGIFAREHLGVRGRFGMWSPIGVPLHGDSGHADDRALRKPLFQIVVFRFPLGQAKTPAI